MKDDFKTATKKTPPTAFPVVTQNWNLKASDSVIVSEVMSPNMTSTAPRILWCKFPNPIIKVTKITIKMRLLVVLHAVLIHDNRAINHPAVIALRNKSKDG